MRMFFLMIAIAITAIPAENITFPSFAFALDVTRPPYNADKSGKTDVTAVIQRAIDQNTFKFLMIYLPNGTYLVSNTIRWKFPPNAIGPHMQGQSRVGTVIRLKDSTFSDITRPKPVLWTGANVAQNMMKGLHNLTVYTGKGNRGAIGVAWYGNNESMMSDVDIISGDGSGAIGLDLGTREQGPSMVRGVYIKGFEIGIKSDALNTVTMDLVRLEGQHTVGIDNIHFPLYIDSLMSVNRVPVIDNHESAQMVICGARLSGGDPKQPAIINRGNSMLYVRSVNVEGYARAMDDSAGKQLPPAGKQIAEYMSHVPGTLSGAPARALRLPVKRPPEPAWESDTGKWASIAQYMTTGRTSAQALQAAVDAKGKTTVVIPCETVIGQKGCADWRINDTVYVRNNIRRIIGTGGWVTGVTFIITDSAAPVVKIEKMQSIGSVVQRSSRTLICESFDGGRIVVDGPGDVFCTDVVCGLTLNDPKAHVWAWHFNAECCREYTPDVSHNLNVNSGTMRIFGWKAEGTGIKVIQTGGVLEVIGFHQYSNTWNMNMEGVPLIVLKGGDFSCAMLTQIAFSGKKYGTIVQETRNGVTRILSNAVLPTEYNVPLFSSYADAP